MIRMQRLRHASGVVHWGRLMGSWGRPECLRLRSYLLRRMALRPGSSVVLDLSAARLHYRAAPILLEIARGIEARRVSFRVAGVSEDLKRIVEVECGLSGRDFLEGHSWVHSPLLGHAGTVPTARPRNATGSPHGLSVPSVN